MPIIVLSAGPSESQKVAALDAGANDYVGKPFGMDELMARIRVALRVPAAPTTPPVIETRTSASTWPPNASGETVTRSV